MPKHRYEGINFKAKIEWLKAHAEMHNKSRIEIVEHMIKAGLYSTKTTKKDVVRTVDKLLEYIKSKK